jgi:hypothetical protein
MHYLYDNEKCHFFVQNKRDFFPDTDINFNRYLFTQLIPVQFILKVLNYKIF